MKRKKLLGLLLSTAMVLTLFPTESLASEMSDFPDEAVMTETVPERDQAMDDDVSEDHDSEDKELIAADEEPETEPEEIELIAETEPEEILDEGSLSDQPLTDEIALSEEDENVVSGALEGCDIIWSLDTDTGKMTFTGEGEMNTGIEYFTSCSYMLPLV